jgi:formylglycine-generating enzyme required for sulfatase activity
VLVPHGSFNFVDISGSIAMPATFTNDVLFDKTEVTVAAFDAWVQAGSPVPADKQSLDPGGPYDGQMYWWGGATTPNWSTYAASLEYKDTSNCTNAYALSANDPAGEDFGDFAPTYPMYEAATGTAKTTAGQYPINCVNFYQAVAYCWWNGHKRLPTEAEWQYEITGRGRSYTYPWGNSPAPSDCSLLIWRDNATASTNPRYNGCGWPKTVGSTPPGASFDGVLDMQGSVEEWIWNGTNGANDFTVQWPPNYAGPNEDAGVDQPREGRGGSFYTDNSGNPVNLDGRWYDNWGTPSTTTYADLGFRCVKSRL